MSEEKSKQWKPEKMSAVPVYKQIALYIKEKIASGEWPVGSKLPTQRALAQAFAVNRSTIITSLEELKAEGLIESTAGSSSKVSNNSWSMLTSTAPPDWSAYVRAGIHKPNLPTIQEINRLEFDHSLIRLGTGELSPELIPAKQMESVLIRVAAKMNDYGYAEPKGLAALREQISEHVKGFGINASPSSILIVSGALQALQLISIGILQRGSTIFLEKPSYLYSLHVFQSTGMRLFGIPLDDAGIKTEWISRYKKQQNGALLYTIPSFHNPTGTLMTDERRKRLMEVCQEEQLPILEDDVYRELWLDEPTPPPLKAMDKNGLVLYLGSLSKTLSPGLRIGWLVGPEPVIERLADIKMQTDYGSSSLSQLAAAEWLSSNDYKHHLQTLREALRIRRDLVVNTLQESFSDLATWQIPHGGFYIWLRLNRPVKMRQLFEEARKAGVLINPGSVYDPGASEFLRISFAYAKLEELVQGIRTLEVCVRRLMQEHAWSNI